MNRGDTNKSSNKPNATKIKLTRWFVDKWEKPFVRQKPHQVNLRSPLPRIHSSIIKWLQVWGILSLLWPISKYQPKLRLLYQHDRLQFEQQLKHCNASISAHRDFECELSRSGVIRMKLRTHIPNEVVSPLNKYDQLVRNYEYFLCFDSTSMSHNFIYFAGWAVWIFILFPPGGYFTSFQLS